MDTTSETRQIAERFLAAANAHDIDGMVSLWEPGGIETFPAFEQSFAVPHEFAQHFRSLFNAIPDVSWKTLSVTADPERAVVRSKMSGTHLGEYQGIAGTGRSFEVDTIDFLQISDGKIVHNDVFFDGLEVLRQLGLMPPSNSRTEKVMRGAFNTLTRLRRRFVTARR